MLSCPYCRTTLTETTAVCPACQLSHAKTTKVMGPTPMLSRGVTDLTGLLTRNDLRVMTRATKSFEREFSRSQFNIVVKAFDQKLTLATGLFWLFNHSALGSTENSLEQNHDLMMAIDPSSGRAALIVGYGLEPFVEQSQLSEILAKAAPHFANGDFGQATAGVVAAVSLLLKEAASTAQIVFGIDNSTRSANEIPDY